MPRAALSNRSGITLVELLVVLVVLGLGTALVAPALVFPDDEEPGRYERVLESGVELAAAREQVVRLVVASDGRWSILAPGQTATLAEGRFDRFQGPAFALAISPLGSCGAEPGSDPPFEVDPLTCAAR